jgi:hypothetical protein
MAFSFSLGRSSREIWRDVLAPWEQQNPQFGAHHSALLFATLPVD